MSSKKINKNDEKASSDVSIEKMKCTKECAKTPSFFNCFPCFRNLNDKNVSETAKDQNLTFDERINYVFTKLYDIDGLNSLATQYKSIVIEDMRQLFREMAKKITDFEKRDENQANPTDAMLDKVRPMIPLDGLKYVNGQKIGYFFCNENNEKGLRLPNINIENLAKMFAENFTDPEGKHLSERTFADNITRGANMKKDEKYSA